MVRLIRESDVESSLAMPGVVTALREAFCDFGNGKAFSQPRSRVKINGEILHVLPAAIPSRDVVGLKTYTAFRSGIHFHVMLYSAATGELKAIMQAKRLGEMRTGGTTSLALQELSNENSTTGALFGVGNLSSAMLDGMLHARPLGRVYICARSQEKAVEFCRSSRWSSEVDLVPTVNPLEAVQSSEIVVTATTAKTPVFDGSVLKPGATIAAVGSNLLQKREIDSQVIRRADRVIVESIEQAALEAGDLFPAIDSGFLHWNEVEQLGEIVSGRRAGRMSESEIILFESVGLGLQDMAVAAKMYQIALDRELGEEIEI